MTSYLNLVSEVVTGYRDEIEADLAEARSLRDRALIDLEEAERGVSHLENLLMLVEGARSTQAVESGRMTLHEAMRVVLESAPGRRMPAAQLAREVDRRGLYKMRNGRPVEPQQVHARVGNYGHMFERDSHGIRLV